MDFALTPDASLAGLFIASFLSATLLPGGSEAVLFAVIKLHPEQSGAALALATLGNTLGGMTTYGMARLLPQEIMRSGQPDGADEAPAQQGGRVKNALLAAADGGTAAHRLNALRRHGTPLLILAWAPIVGDVLCAAAGWLRLAWFPCMLWMAAGKAARYLVVVAGAGLV